MVTDAIFSLYMMTSCSSVSFCRNEKKEEYIKKKKVEKLIEKRKQEMQQAKKEERSEKAMEEYERWLVCLVEVFFIFCILSKAKHLM